MDIHTFQELLPPVEVLCSARSVCCDFDNPLRVSRVIKTIRTRLSNIAEIPWTHLKRNHVSIGGSALLKVVNGEQRPIGDVDLFLVSSDRRIDDVLQGGWKLSEGSHEGLISYMNMFGTFTTYKTRDLVAECA